MQRNLEAATGISGVRESVTLINCLQEPDCEAVSYLLGVFRYLPVYEVAFFLAFGASMPLIGRQERHPADL